MKIRTGHVSNSSSQSFMAIAFDVTNFPDIKKRIADLDSTGSLGHVVSKAVFFNSGETGSSTDGRHLIGLDVAEEMGYHFSSDIEVDISDMINELSHLKEALGVEDSPIKLLTGMRMSNNCDEKGDTA